MPQMRDVLLVETFDMHTKLFGEMAGRFLGELFEQRLQFGVGRGVGHSWPEPHRWVIKVVGTVRQLQGEIHVCILPGRSGRHSRPRWCRSSEPTESCGPPQQNPH